MTNWSKVNFGLRRARRRGGGDGARRARRSPAAGGRAGWRRGRADRRRRGAVDRSTARRGRGVSTAAEALGDPAAARRRAPRPRACRRRARAARSGVEPDVEGDVRSTAAPQLGRGRGPDVVRVRRSRQGSASSSAGRAATMEEGSRGGPGGGEHTNALGGRAAAAPGPRTRGRRKCRRNPADAPRAERCARPVDDGGGRRRRGYDCAGCPEASSEP